MIYNFDTDDKDTAVAALIVYSIYRSRDKTRFKVSLDMWGQIDRFVKSSAKRASNLQRFIDNLMPRMSCAQINPKWLDVGVTGATRILKAGDEYIGFSSDGMRSFMTDIIKKADHKKTLDILYKETTWVIMLVRDRLETEKPLESKFEDKE